MNYLNASCVISHQRIRKDEIMILENNEGDLPAFLGAVYAHFDFQYPKFYKMDTLSKLGWLAAELLLQDGFPKSQYAPENIGVILSNANASLDTDLKYWETVKTMPSPALFVYTLPNIVAGEIAIRHQFKGENAFFIGPTFDAGTLHWYTNDLLDNGRLAACICGWVEELDNRGVAALFLVEKERRGAGIPFNEAAIQRIFAGDNE